ncbi:MAG: hypothetical protein KME29_04605 [Calothrix sp. FI2-JRJ7]|nr:hypothetical protein [Calothrix sp. FI2-JRJ7]
MLEEIAQQRWVTSINTQMEQEKLKWEIGVTDADWAEHQLLRIVLKDPSIKVVQFGVVSTKTFTSG